MVDFVEVLDRAVTALDPNTEEARRALYDRARRALVDGLRASDPTLAHSALQKEAAALEAAIQRVEAVWIQRTAPPVPEQAYRADPLPVDDSVEEEFDALPPPKEQRNRIVIGAIGALAILLVCAGGYFLWPRGHAPARDVAGRAASHDPAVPGASYVYLRQPVYYRSEYPAGTIVIDKAQNFLYVVRPSVSALRYGIGVGPECTATAGLYKIMRKEEWPGWKPPQTAEAIRAAEEQMKNPLGARALYLTTDYRIHGTNAPASIGRSAPQGCIRLINDDVIYLYDRAPLETRVVVLN